MDNSKDITVDLPLDRETASALYVILDLFIQAHQGLETIEPPADFPGDKEGFAEFHQKIMTIAEELKVDVAELIEEIGEEPESKIIKASKFS